MLAEQKDAQRERMLKARKAQFQYGRDQTDYQTSVAHNFVQHDLNQVATAKKERDQNGKDLRSVHFTLGHDNLKEEAIAKGENAFYPASKINSKEPNI